MSVVYLPRPNGNPYANDLYVPVTQIVCWYKDRDSACTCVEIAGKGTVKTSLYPAQVAELYNAAINTPQSN